MSENPASCQEFDQRWKSISEPGWEINEQVFSEFHAGTGKARKVLNCATPSARARQLTDFQMPKGWSPQKCLITSGRGHFEPGLEHWKYTPQIRPEAQLPQLLKLPRDHTNLSKSPWFQSSAQASGMLLNSRHLRYHHQLWHDLKPKTLRGLHTTLVFVTPQIGYSLTPHIRLQRAFWYLSALARSAGPAQLFPTQYLYPDANLAGLQHTPAPIFADLLPCTGGVNYPALECTPDPWGVITQFDQSDRNYGYPFHHITDSSSDITLNNVEPGVMLMPDGRRVWARNSESFVYATLDKRLGQDLMQDREQFSKLHALGRGTITHDGLPFQLPVEMQCMAFAVILTHWEINLDQPGDLTSYSIKTRHAAIRGFNFYQRVEPYYSSFMRLVHEVEKDPGFCTYPLATHLTHNWLGGNLCISDQASRSEREIGADLMRNYYLQQLDWMAGVFNLWNHVEFRKGSDLETNLNQDGLAFHQMRRMLKMDSHYFPRATKKVSAWPNLHPGWLEYDRKGITYSLPKV